MSFYFSDELPAVSLALSGRRFSGRRIAGAV